MEGITNKEEEIFFAIELDLFTLGTITLLKLEIFNVIFSMQKLIHKTLPLTFHTLREKFGIYFTYIHQIPRIEHCMLNIT
jgi:hypothetical protein